MESRSRILDAIKTNKPAEVALPSVQAVERNPTVNNLEAFKDIVQRIGGRAEEVQYDEIQQWIDAAFPDAVHTASSTDFYQGTIKLDDVKEPKELEKLDVFVCKGVLGVAENGAIWVPENEIRHRVAPFITQHLVVLLNANSIVEDMHAAYDEIDIVGSGFGVFVAGPSKTADIEQSLVLGAHGPRSMAALLISS